MTVAAKHVPTDTPAGDAGLPWVPPARPGAGHRAGGWAVRIGVVAVAALVWQLLTTNHVALPWIRFDTLPSVSQIFAEFGHALGTRMYYLDLLQSLIRIGIGFALAAALGIPAGVALGRSSWAQRSIGTLFELARPVPAITLVPIMILMLPSAEAGMVAITAIAAFFPIVVSVRHSVRALPTVWEESVRTLGGGRIAVITRVVLPGSLPGVFSGLSVGIGVSWICLVSAEMISGHLGVGYRTWQAYTVIDYPGVFVGMITIGVLGFATSALLELLGRRATRWLPRSER
ncbi:ABC transporter permease [Tsukamurella sp. 8F]|uniref:ABC transporter permease n=1 Tax=unclassified Tsukamurella TaxID=2633480 RepID=UPI0023B9195B|nr:MULTISPECIES: ABC transporter permease [unclassified Tsukamurella]MDF0528607.1 ABC transporter permease [Tsukamurella sp. 8J]MDF0585569.1 ABC transporter permease [Tsukamurella sp. 8F]